MSASEVHKVMVDETSARILLTTQCRPLTALQIARATGIPVAHVFHRIRQLERMELLHAELRLVDCRGREVLAYCNTLRDGCILAEGGRLKVRYRLVTGAPEASSGRRRQR